MKIQTCPVITIALLPAGTRYLAFLAASCGAHLRFIRSGAAALTPTDGEASKDEPPAPPKAKKEKKAKKGKKDKEAKKEEL